MHPSISINSLCINAGSLGANADMVARLGAAGISPLLEEVEAIGGTRAAALLRDAGLVAATLTHRAFGYASASEAAAARERLVRTIDLARTIGADSITLTTGGRGPLNWTEAAARFAAEIAPCVDVARAAGVALSLEPTSHLYADASIAHCLRDTVTLARDAGISLGIDLFACWFDADIYQAIAAAGPLCRLVQVSDYVAGDRALPCRAVPGDGMVPLDRLISAIRRTGYRGWFDIEVIGPRLEAEGVAAAMRRAATILGKLLECPVPAPDCTLSIA